MNRKMKDRTMKTTTHWSSREQEEFIEMENYVMIRELKKLIESKEEDIKRCKIQIHEFNQKIIALKEEENDENKP